MGNPRSDLAQAARFGAVGAAATVLNGVAYGVLSHHNHLRPVWANVVGFALAFLVSFAGHRQWTFAAPSGSRHAATSLARFFITALTGLGLNSLAVWLLTGPLQQPPASALPVIVLVTPVLLFLLSKHWAFASSEGNRREPADKPGSV